MPFRPHLEKHAGGDSRADPAYGSRPPSGRSSASRKQTAQEIHDLFKARITAASKAARQELKTP